MRDDTYIPERAAEEVLTTESAKPSFLGQNAYEFLRWMTQYVVPGVGTLYFALASIWGFPYGEQVVGTTVALTTFLGVIIGISRAQYNSSGQAFDGIMVVDESDPEKDVYRLTLNRPVGELADLSAVTFKVANSQ